MDRSWMRSGLGFKAETGCGGPFPIRGCDRTDRCQLLAARSCVRSQRCNGWARCDALSNTVGRANTRHHPRHPKSRTRIDHLIVTFILVCGTHKGLPADWIHEAVDDLGDKFSADFRTADLRWVPIHAAFPNGALVHHGRYRAARAQVRFVMRGARGNLLHDVCRRWCTNEEHVAWMQGLGAYPMSTPICVAQRLVGRS